MRKILTLFLMFFACIHAKSQVEDYIQYTPAIANFALGACGIEHKHDTGDRIFLNLSSWAIMYGVTGTLKHEIKEERPDHSDMKSFPSGHAARSFCGATILAHEYGETSPWIAVAGYAIATTTAVLRVTGDHHYTHDVIAGAAIGIASAECSYLLLPTWQRLRKKWQKKNKSQSSDLSFFIAPSLGINQTGLAGCLTF